MHEVNADRPILVHGSAEVRAALGAAASLGVGVRLCSAPGAGCHGGGAWFRALIEDGRREFPEVPVTAVLDCADRPGAALAALRAGVPDVALAGKPDLLERVRAIAEAQGARLHTPCAGGLDLRGRRDALEACRLWLLR
ncbi:hypothetical protein [Arenibaculum pallidiluteum]|uniref:hypothetical protein n=1 Tax=Arenibaculum pallidiluteum TaxID=2812559 RepID=UPI001A96444A|nr:hypothetical protein [Arenibaculum pallidiluteum]